jgi:hypothetical protein
MSDKPHTIPFPWIVAGERCALCNRPVWFVPVRVKGGAKVNYPTAPLAMTMFRIDTAGRGLRTQSGFPLHQQDGGAAPDLACDQEPF